MTNLKNMKKNIEQGFTLAETLVVIGITGLLMIGVTTLFTDVFVNSRQQNVATNTIDDARRVTSTFVNEIRNLAYGADGAYPIASAASGDLTFYTTYRAGGAVNKVSYNTSGGTLYKTITPPAGTPPTYGTGTTKVALPGETFPSVSFSYYDGNYTGFSTGALNTPWIQRASPNIKNWDAIAYGNGIYVAVADNSTGTGSVMTSPDGITWTVQNTPPANRKWDGLAFGNGVFVAVSRDGTTNNCVMYSTDGINWLTGNSNLSGIPAASEWRSITYGNGLFVAVAGCPSGVCPSQGVMTSPDGANWTGRTTSGVLAKSWQNVTYGNGLFVAVSRDFLQNNIMTSTNGTSWTIRNTPAAHSWYGVTYGNGLYVAVAHDSSTNDVLTSPDGITWTARAGAATSLWSAVAFGNNQFVAVADAGGATTPANSIMISPDGISWSTMAAPSHNGSTAYNWRAVTFANDLFIAVGGGAGAGSSSDYYIMTAGASDIATGVYAGSSLPTPVNVNNVKFITMSLSALKSDITGSAASFVVTEGAAVRNLKTNLGN